MLTIRLSWQYPKDTSPLIINQNNLKVFRDVFIPQTIAVIEETQITCNQSSLHLGSYTGTFQVVYNETAVGRASGGGGLGTLIGGWADFHPSWE